VTQIATAGHVTGRNCDRRTGLVSDETQADGTNAAYNIVRTMGYDALGRLLSLTEASGSATAKTTTTQYDDVNRKVTMTTPLDATRNLVTVNSYDELGRVVKSQAPDDDGALNIAVDRVYRSVPGDFASYEAVSNPYCTSTTTRCSNTGVVGWTRTKRDQNGRVIQVQTLDGSGQPGPWGANTTSTGSVTTAYSVETATVTDQAAKARKSAVDAAGRVASVVEDPNGTPVTTSYGYDALGNLTGVNPGGGASQRERTFAYDSLKRLSSATNPESGRVSYTYDANSNVMTKTDARGVVANVVASFSYDNLNRVYLRATRYRAARLTRPTA
jgi:YD repeat-containing protein